MTYSELPKYEHKWIEYRTPKGIKTNETELYISEFGDTIIFQNKVFENAQIDTTRSTFLDFKAQWVNDSTIGGSITVYARNDHLIKSPLIERTLNLQFVQSLDGNKKAVRFNTLNENSIKFKFQNDSDSLIGLLTDYRQYDTIMNETESTRIIETKYPLDNKSITNNIFIHVHDLNKKSNKR